MTAAFLLLLGALGAAEPHLTNNQLHGAASAAAAPTCNELSTSLGSHMVLQRAPEHAVVFGSVCGKLAGAKSVSVVVDGAAPTTVPIAPGSLSWAVKIPPQAGGVMPHTLKISGGAFAVTLDDVLFGDVILCSGQVRDNSQARHVPAAPWPVGCLSLSTLPCLCQCWHQLL